MPAPADQNAETVDLDQVRAAASFGELSFEDYVAHCLAESERMYLAQSRKAA